MNEENERERRADEVTVVDQEVAKISQVEVKRTLKRMKRELVLVSERMPEEWRSVLVLIFKKKGDMQSCYEKE